MPRSARLRVQGAEAWYHIHSKAAGVKGEYVLQDPLCQRRMVEIIQHYASAYCCDVAAFCVMGNHYHLVVRFDAPHELSHTEMWRRALALYPNSREQIKSWPEAKWERLWHRLFDISEMMRNVQMAFSRWYNKTHQRRGRFWAERFSSTLLEDAQTAWDCMLYVELNPVRAGLVTRPEEWSGSSAFQRHAGQCAWMLALDELLGEEEDKAEQTYRGCLYHRGGVPSKEGQASIPAEVIEQEAARGFAASGVFLRRLRYFADGLALGSEEFIRLLIHQLRAGGQYLRRRHPIPLPAGQKMALREQRRHGGG